MRIASLCYSLTNFAFILFLFFRSYHPFQTAEEHIDDHDDDDGR